MLLGEAEILKPLNQSELIKYFESFKNGDTKAREILINHNIRLVLFRVNRRFCTFPCDKEELFSVGLIGLIKSVDTFDIDKKTSFTTYASRCIDNEILAFIHNNKKHIKHVSLNAPINKNNDEFELTLADILNDFNDDFVLEYEEKELSDAVRLLVEKLPERKKKIITMYFGFNGEPLKQKEISNNLGVTQACVSKTIISTIKELKNQLETDSFSTKPNTYINATSKNTKKNTPTLKTIYEFFSSYTKDEIDLVFSQLDDEEKELIKLRYGDDLKNPVTNPSWSRKHMLTFYYTIMPKMRERLQKMKYKRNGFKDKREIFVPTQTKVQNVSLHSDKTEEKNNISNASDEEHSVVKKLISTKYFEELSKELSVSVEEATIICLSTMSINGQRMDAESIANFLDIKPSKIEEVLARNLGVSCTNDEIQLSKNEDFSLRLENN